MATWHGIPKKFNLQVCSDDFYEVLNAEVEMNWSYNTTSDTLVIETKVPNRALKKQLLGQDLAEATLKILMDWYATYESVEQLETMLNEIKEAKRDGK